MLLIDLWHPPFWISLVVIVGVLSITALLSLRAPSRPPEAVEGAPDSHPRVHEPLGRQRRGRRAEPAEAKPVGAGRRR